MRDSSPFESTLNRAAHRDAPEVWVRDRDTRGMTVPVLPFLFGTLVGVILAALAIWEVLP